jgi:hypothetical protein
LSHNSSSQRHFNPIQTQTFAALYESNDSALVCAPSGSGTIVCGEFAILRHFKLNPNASAVYVAPKVRGYNICVVHVRYMHAVLSMRVVVNNTDICN